MCSREIPFSAKLRSFSLVVMIIGLGLGVYSIGYIIVAAASDSLDQMCEALEPTTVPDHPDIGRWCKQCKSYKPLENFPAGRRQYKCKEHCWSSAKAR
jgi:hypothetical protein